tara:strand:+ start:313 stop:501 length:189 start_codon:yes stop_codon:yes gene_type:complete
MEGAFYDTQEKPRDEVNEIKAKVYAENMMRQYRETTRIVKHNFGTPTADEFKKLVINKFKNL